ncbi:MAG: hypothetical protein ACFFA5_04045 [Promethearchaeota archaeon]
MNKQQILKSIKSFPIKEFLTALFIIWFSATGISVFHTFNAIQHLDFDTQISTQPHQISLKPEIHDFGAKTFGEPCVGDTIEIFVKISNKNSESGTINVIIKDEINGKEEQVIWSKKISISHYSIKEIESNYLLKRGGKHKVSLYCVIDGKEHFLGKSFSLKVKSFKDDTHFVLSYFHFNLQFYCGNYESEESIINDLIRNLLEFYDDNPQYKFTFEIQGYAIEVMDRDYPDVLELIRDLTKRGQMELVVTHYSDQFFVAYPKLDLMKSIEVSDEILEKNDIKRSNVFGAQEWQWSPILPEIMRKYGYNIYLGRDRAFRKYDQVQGSHDPYKENFLWQAEWNEESAYIVLDHPATINISSNDDDKTLYYEWAYHGDGEILNGKKTGIDFEFEDSKQEKYERDLERYEDDGYKFVTVSELVYTALEKGFEAEKAESVVDLAQGDLYVWMGRNKNEYEDNNYINTLRYQARTSLLSAETLIKIAEDNNFDVSDQKDTLSELWKELLLSEVTDGTGWTPKEFETKYAKEKAKSVTKISKELTFNMTKKLGITSEVVIDTKTDNIVEDFGIPHYEETETPINISISCDNYTYTCYNYTDRLYLLEIRINATREKQIGITFNLTDSCYYSPMGTKYLNASKYWDESPLLTLANGWIYLGNDVNIIKDCTTRHIGAELNQTYVKFMEEYLEGEFVYRFYIYYGDMEEAFEFANRLNVKPSVLSSDITQAILTTEMLEKYCRDS